jgi:hypothetical protein
MDVVHLQVSRCMNEWFIFWGKNPQKIHSILFNFNFNLVSVVNHDNKVHLSKAIKSILVKAQVDTSRTWDLLQKQVKTNGH